MSNENVLKIEMSAETWNDVIVPISSISNEVRLKVSKEGIKYAVVNTKNVALTYADISIEAFEDFIYDKTEGEEEFGFNLDHVMDLKVKKGNIVLEILYTVNKGEYQYRVTYGNHTRYITIYPVETLRKAPVIPNFEENTTNEYTMPAKELLEYVKKLKKLDEKVEFRAIEEGLKIVGSDGTTKHEYICDVDTVNDSDKYLYSIMSVAYLESILKNIKTKDIVLKFGTDTPMIIRYYVSKWSNVTFMIAPRIENH